MSKVTQREGYGELYFNTICITHHYHWPICTFIQVVGIKENLNVDMSK